MTNPSELYRTAMSEPDLVHEPEPLPSPSLGATWSGADDVGVGASGQAQAQARADNARLQLAVEPGMPFKAHFCRHFGCAEEKFEQELFWRALPPLARLPAWLIVRLAPHYYRREFQFLTKLGRVRGFDELRLKANSARWSASMRSGVVRKWLRMRISGRRLLSVGTEVLLD